MDTPRKRPMLTAAVLCAAFLLSSPAPGASSAPEAFLGITELADGWTSSYGGMRSMEVAYSDNLVDFAAPAEDPEAKRPLAHLHVERIEQGKRHHTRYSMAQEGFADSDATLVQAFDGEMTTDYTPRHKLGRILPGLTGNACEMINGLSMFLLLDPVRSREHPEGVPRIQTLLTMPDAKVLPQLESVGGQWCHVVENAWEGGRIRTWIAQDAGFLPLKYEKAIEGRFRDERVVQEIASVQTETGVMWYPVKAKRTVYSPTTGTITTAFAAQKFVPNVAVTDETFRVAFPSDTHILDKARNLDYVLGSGLDEHIRIDMHGELGREPRPAEEPQTALEENVEQDIGAAAPGPRQPQGESVETLGSAGDGLFRRKLAAAAVVLGIVLGAGLLVRNRMTIKDKGSDTYYAEHES